MAEALFSLAIIMIVAFLCPFIASIVPGKWLQSSALVLIAGAVLGPHMLGLINPQAEGMALLKQLGLAFIFLMGGYELSPKAVVGKTGRHAIASWALSFLFALGAALLVEHLVGSWTQATIVAFAIALASTSYGKVEADVKNRKLGNSKFTQVVASYGATGELLPVVATAILIGEGAPAIELAIMAGFALLALAASRFAEHEQRKKTEIEQFVENSANASQMMTQLVVAITIVLVALGVILGADMIVSGFAAGYILKRLVPESGSGNAGENSTIDSSDGTSSATSSNTPIISITNNGTSSDSNNKALVMLRAISYGFFIPIAFVLSGCSVDILAGAQEPLVILLFIALLLIVRGIPVYAGVTLFPGDNQLSRRQRIAVALYACTTMSTVVAMTGVAVDAGDMTSGIASSLVFAAALVTIIIPIAVRLVDPEHSVA